MSPKSLQHALGLAVLAGALAAGGAAAPPAAAAVKVCRAPQSSGVVAAATETEAKRKAIEAWTLKVKVSMEARFAGWPAAVNRVVRCAPPKDGVVQCIAIATPCVIQQVPPKPEQKRKPGGANKPIEI